MLNPIYNKLLQSCKPIDKESEMLLILDYQTNPCTKEKNRIAEKIIRANFRFIYKLSYQFYSKFLKKIDLNDLIQEASLAMIKTLDKFNVSSGYALLTYYSFQCRAFLQRYYQNFGSTIRKPTYISENIRKVKKASTAYKEEHGIYPSANLLPELTGLSVTQIDTVLIAMKQKATSLDQVVASPSNSNKTELIDFIPASNKEVEEAEQIELAKLTEKCLEQLSEVERLAVVYRYGLNKDSSNNKPNSLSVVARKLEVSREGARGILLRAERQLRANPEVKELFDLYLCEAG